MRIVLDTNILVSALFWNGKERRVLKACRKKKHQLIISPQILEELKHVLVNKFNIPSEKALKYQEDILMFSEISLPQGKLNVIKDDKSDNIILETAVAGKADLLITGDRHLLNLEKYNRIRIKKTAFIVR